MIVILITENRLSFECTSAGVRAIGFDHIIYQQNSLLAFEQMMRFDFLDKVC